MRTTPLERVDEPYDEQAMKSTSAGSGMARRRSAMKTKAPFSTPMSSGSRPS